MRLEFCRAWENGAEAGTLKDAGDDPDVTRRPGVRPGAPGRRAWRALPCRPRVGTVTRPG